MTPTAKRYFLMGYLGLAGMAAVGCGALLLAASGYRAKDEAMTLGLASGYCLVLILIAFTAMDRKIWRVVAILGIALSVVAMLHTASFILYQHLASGGRWGPDRDWGRWIFTSMSTAGLVCLGAGIGALRM